MKPSIRSPREPYLYQKLYRKLEIAYERLLGVDFSTVTPSSELGLDELMVVHGAPCGSKYLYNVLEKFDITEADSILDVGSAKGSSIRYFTKFEFGKISGIGLAPQLVKTAIKNFQKLQQDKVDFLCINAIDYKNYGSYNFFHLCNPFPKPIFKLFLFELLSQINKDTPIYNL